MDSIPLECFLHPWTPKNSAPFSSFPRCDHTASNADNKSIHFLCRWWVKLAHVHLDKTNCRKRVGYSDFFIALLPLLLRFCNPNPNLCQACRLVVKSMHLKWQMNIGYSSGVQAFFPPSNYSNYETDTKVVKGLICLLFIPWYRCNQSLWFRPSYRHSSATVRSRVTCSVNTWKVNFSCFY